MKIREITRADVETYNLLLNVINKGDFSFKGPQFKDFQKAFAWLDNLGIALSEGWNAVNDTKNKDPKAGPTNVKIKNPEPSKV